MPAVSPDATPPNSGGAATRGKKADVLRGFSRRKQPALELLAAMQMADLVPNVISCNAAIAAGASLVPWLRRRAGPMRAAIVLAACAGLVGVVAFSPTLQLGGGEEGSGGGGGGGSGGGPGAADDEEAAMLSGSTPLDRSEGSDDD